LLFIFVRPYCEHMLQGRPVFSSCARQLFTSALYTSSSCFCTCVLIFLFRFLIFNFV
jgi:hypothetical protein